MQRLTHGSGHRVHVNGRGASLHGGGRSKERAARLAGWGVCVSQNAASFAALSEDLCAFARLLCCCTQRRRGKQRPQRERNFTPFKGTDFGGCAAPKAREGAAAGAGLAVGLAARVPVVRPKSVGTNRAWAGQRQDAGIGHKPRLTGKILHCKACEPRPGG